MSNMIQKFNASCDEIIREAKAKYSGARKLTEYLSIDFKTYLRLSVLYLDTVWGMDEFSLKTFCKLHLAHWSRILSFEFSSVLWLFARGQ